MFGFGIAISEFGHPISGFGHQIGDFGMIPKISGFVPKYPEFQSDRGQNAFPEVAGVFATVSIFAVS